MNPSAGPGRTQGQVAKASPLRPPAHRVIAPQESVRAAGEIALNLLHPVLDRGLVLEPHHQAIHRRRGVGPIHPDWVSVPVVIRPEATHWLAKYTAWVR